MHVFQSPEEVLSIAAALFFPCLSSDLPQHIHPSSGPARLNPLHPPIKCTVQPQVQIYASHVKDYCHLSIKCVDSSFIVIQSCIALSAEPQLDVLRMLLYIPYPPCCLFPASQNSIPGFVELELYVSAINHNVRRWKEFFVQFVMKSFLLSKRRHLVLHYLPVGTAFKNSSF